MPSAALIAESNKQRQAKAWFWLYDIELDTDAAESRWLSLAGTDEDVTYRGRTYTAYPVTHGDIEATGGGDIPKLDAAISNVDGSAAEFLRTYDGLEDRRIRIRLVHEDLVSLDVDTVPYDTKIASATIRNEVVVFQLGEPPLHALFFPSGVFSRLKCRHRFRGPRCGWTSAQAGSATSCDLSLDGPNGCVAHNNETRWGGYASLPGGR